MRKVLPPIIEKGRELTGRYGSPPNSGPNGRFIIHLDKRRIVLILASDGLGWEHVSVTIWNPDHTSAERCPTWEEMCWAKDMFWEPEEAVIQIHPKQSEYVNGQPYCLHLWKPSTYELILPHPNLVGLRPPAKIRH